MNITLAELKKRVITLVENPACEQKSRAWLTAAFVSLCAADELKYVDDTFHSFSIQEQIDTLKSIAETRIFAIDISSKDKGQQDHAVIWLRGFYFNDALMRMAALAERGLVNLWELINIDPRNCKIAMNKTCQYNYWKLKNWYENIFNEDLETVNKVREQVNVFKHSPRISGLLIIDSIDEAILVLSKVIDILEKGTKKPTETIKQLHDKWCRQSRKN